MTHPDSQDHIHDLNSGWTLHHDDRGLTLPAQVPFDVHSRLCAEGVIEDPYWRDRELELDWIHQADWRVTRKVTLSEAEIGGTWTLRFNVIDCVATIRVNGTVVGETRSAYLRHDFDVGSALRAGENTIEVVLHSNSKAAVEAAKAFPFKLPYLEWNCRIPDVNLLRKAACHAGWDWNIALMPAGIYGDVTLVRSDIVRLDEIKLVQHHENGTVRLDIHTYATGNAIGSRTLSMEIDGQRVESEITVVPGENSYLTTITIDKPEYWWPAGHGAQPLYPLMVNLDGHTIHRKIGLRAVELITTPDAAGARFVLAVNDVEIFMKGANWIPADALPERGTPEVTRDLLTSAVEANMNMIRIWGGGQYEADWFYDMCDELGLMVWQDFMFACNHYPGSDPAYLKLVRTEARQQIRRLSTHPSLALWCGDNELVGALNWFEETNANRDRYLANYVILNHALGEMVDHEAVDVPFWPSSPSSGRLNFGDAWHDDGSGDMHFWSVWHEAKDFEHYRTVRPRFCSEFGFQSFPSMRCIERFSEPADRNISSAVMDIHQRNVGGNSRIVETLARNVRFPEKFEDMVFLSQVNQGMALKTAIEFWRVQSPHCMGTLYWQLNDTWPVASWASLEHGGAWKLSHYMARNFFQPVLVCAQPDEETGEIVIYGVSDAPGGSVSLSVGLSAHKITGGGRTLESVSATLPYNTATELARLAPDALMADEFLHIQWQDDNKAHQGENIYFVKRFKAYDLPQATIKSTLERPGTGVSVTLETDVPAYFVVLGLGGTDRFSDGGFTLLPGQPKTITLGDGKDLTGPPTVHYLNNG